MLGLSLLGTRHWVRMRMLVTVIGIGIVWKDWVGLQAQLQKVWIAAAKPIAACVIAVYIEML